MSQNNQAMKRQQPRRMMLFCEPCGHKKIIEVADITITAPDSRMATPQVSVPHLNGVENKTSPIQLRLPQFDAVTGKTIQSKFQPQPKRYKCPCCGRPAKLRELLKPFSDALQTRDDEARKRQEEEEKLRRIADGKPEEKKVDPDFLG
jgi:hypothetical protein